MVEIEESLKKVQIEYIIKELTGLKLYYNEATDLEYIHIVAEYTAMLEQATELDDLLTIYKIYYQNVITYFFEVVESDKRKSDEDFEYLEEEKVSKEELPF